MFRGLAGTAYLAATGALAGALATGALPMAKPTPRPPIRSFGAGLPITTGSCLGLTGLL